MRWSRGEAVCCVIPKAEGKPTGPAAPCATPAANASAPETSARIPATPRARVEPGLEGPERRVWPGAGPSFAPPSPDRLRRWRRPPSPRTSLGSAAVCEAGAGPRGWTGLVKARKSEEARRKPARRERGRGDVPGGLWRGTRPIWDDENWLFFFFFPVMY